MIERGSQFGIISNDKIINLYRTLNYHDWKKIEPLDAETPVTEPLSISQTIGLLIDENVMTGYEIRKNLMYKFNLHITQKMMAEVCNIEEYVFTSNNNINLNLKVRPFPNSEKN